MESDGNKNSKKIRFSIKTSLWKKWFENFFKTIQFHALYYSTFSTHISETTGNGLEFQKSIEKTFFNYVIIIILE